MDLKEKAKQELETRIEKIENLIANRGVGAKYLRKAQRTQRNVNLALLAGSLIAITGIAFYALSSSDEDDES